MSFGTQLLVHVVLAVSSLLASLVQGVVGFGDALVLHVLWYTASTIAPGSFPEPVRTVVLLLYVRVVFVAPLVLYLTRRDGLFSLSMAAATSAASTIAAVVGVFLFADMAEAGVAMALGTSSLVFAALGVVVVAGRLLWRRHRVRQITTQQQLINSGGAALTASAVAAAGRWSAAAVSSQVGDRAAEERGHTALPAAGGPMDSLPTEAEAVANELRCARVAGGGTAASDLLGSSLLEGFLPR